MDEYHVVVDIGRHDSIGYYSCSCPAFRQYYGACKHVVAVLLEISYTGSASEVAQRIAERRAKQSELNALRQKAEVRRSVQKLISASVENNLQKQSPPEETARRFRLVPLLSLEEQEPCFLSVTVGETRQYIVRDLMDFSRQVREGEPVTYGKQKPVVHRLQDFEPESAPLVSFLLRQVQEVETME